MVCHSFLQWTTSCQTSPSWPSHLGWPHMAWLSFIELDKAVVHVIRLTSFLWLWFVCLPSDASCNTYRLTWVSLTSEVGYLFTAAPAKRSRCSLPWMRGISSQPPLLTSVRGSSCRPCFCGPSVAEGTLLLHGPLQPAVPVSGSSPMNQLFASDGQIIGVDF